jgi:AcrR family transcriptional regulator
LADGSPTQAARVRAGKTRSRDDIVAEAVRLFSVQGYSGTTIRDIAKGVGLLPGSLYAHIDDKESLLVDIVEGGIDTFLSAIEPIAESDDPADFRLRETIKRHCEIIAENVEQTLIVFHQWKYLGPERKKHVIDKRNRYEEAFRRIIQDGVEAGVFSKDLNTRIAVLSVLGMLNWVPEWYRPDGPEPAEEVAERLADVILTGLLDDDR